ncbi:MAG: hypothetical protein NUV74_09880, partial [Candidatus Brocadiaceae bacterium]|nr:hypothetical protein [Candidatus Brocadiaceae bacterium]
MNKPFPVSLIFLLASQLLFTPLQNAYTQSRENSSEQTATTTVNLNQVNDVSTTYKDVFGQFGDNAERLYQQYDAFALEFLKEYKIEGLVLLEKHGRELANLHPLLDYRDVFRLYSNPGNNINNLNIFSPETLSQFYKTFGDEGIKWIARNPENFFIISEDKDKGVELMSLANEKGDIVFPLTRKHGITFVRLYDKDVLNIVIKFQEDGLLAVKEFGEKAKILFHLFIDDDTFYHVIKTYGHKQTIPIIYLFYDNNDFNNQVYDYMRKTKVYEWVSDWWYSTDTSTPNTQSDAVIRRENAQRAVNLIFELGND